MTSISKYVHFYFVKEDPKEAKYAELISQVGKRALKMIFTIKQH